MKKSIYLNLSVSDLKKTMVFYSSLGFTFNEQFTNEDAACMTIEENIFVMLLQRPFFESFIPERTICDLTKSVEALIGIDVENRDLVDQMIGKVIKAGGKEYREASDHGWMYSRSFTDPDGHIWEVIYMDESRIPADL